MPEELKLLEEWKVRLRLQDWNIILETNCQPDNMVLEESDGCVDYAETIKAAKIQIIDPEKRGKDSLRPFIFEEVLVHELLHLKFCLLARGDDWDNKLQLRLLHQIIG